MAITANILGYTKFEGVNGIFTIPVIRLKGFAVTTKMYEIFITDIYSEITRVQFYDIYALLTNPPRLSSENPGLIDPFSSGTNVQFVPFYMKLDANSPAVAIFYDSVWVTTYIAENPGYSPCFVKADDDNYYIGLLRDNKLVIGGPKPYETTPITGVVTQSNPILPSPNVPSPTKFYLSSPNLPLYVSRGEPVNLEFSLEYSDGSLRTNVPFTYEATQPDATGVTNWTIEGNILTFTNECWYAVAWIRFHSEDYPELEYELEVHIKDPMPQPNLPGPYLPPDGGISGGGNGSTGSNTVTGTFDAQPGPSIVENLPNGSSGSDIASSGMYTKYLCNNALLNLLAGFFWEDNVGIQALKAVLGNPIDSIISLAAYPFALDTLVPTTSTTIYFGQYDSHFSAFSLTKSSFQIDWGTVTIPFFWGSFLDYSPYTKIQLYLPWGVGFVSIDPNEVVPWSSKNSFNQGDFVNGTIRVITNIELDKGACVHNIVGNNGRIIGSFGGVVGKQVPVTGSDNSARILAMMSAAVSSSAAVGMAAGGAVAAGKNLAYGKGMTTAERAEGREMIGNYKSSVGGAIQSLSGGLASPPTYPRAGTFSDATNTLGYQYPYLIISRPSQSVPQQYGRFMGYPSNIFHAHLGEVRGYTEVSSIHLDNITATANELDELESILKGGVLL